MLSVKGVAMPPRSVGKLQPLAPVVGVDLFNGELLVLYVDVVLHGLLFFSALLDPPMA
jgi:hypothetical protein